MCQRLNDISTGVDAVVNKIDYRFSHLKIEKGRERKKIKTKMYTIPSYDDVFFYIVVVFIYI